MHYLFQGKGNIFMELNVTVYSTTNCGYCELMKNFLKEQNIDFKVVNIHNDPNIAQFLMEKTGRLGAPQTCINDAWVLGYDPNNAMKIIERLKSL